MNMAEFLQAAKPKSDGRAGVTLRDQFAMAVLTGLASNVSRFDLTSEGYGPLMREDLASCAYKVADAMLKEREK